MNCYEEAVDGSSFELSRKVRYLNTCEAVQNQSTAYIIQEKKVTHFSLLNSQEDTTVYTLIRKSPRWYVFTQAWGYIVITSYLGVFKFACVISQGFGLLLNKLYYNCMSYILTLHIKQLCKIKGTLDLFYQAIFPCNYMKVVCL